MLSLSTLQVSLAEINPKQPDFLKTETRLLSPRINDYHSIVIIKMRSVQNLEA